MVSVSTVTGVHLVSTFRRIVFFAQWPAAFLAPIWLLVAPGAFQPGWAAVLATLTAPLLFLITIVPPIICVCVGNVRRSRMAPAAYSVLVAAMWVAVVVFGISFPGASDVRSYPSLIEHAGVSSDAADSIATVSILAMIGLSVAIIVAAAVGAAQAKNAGLRHEPLQP